MSNVQTQIDRINGEVSAQKALISQIATALEGKAGGGGELKSATGTKSFSAIAKSVTITGLNFKPSIVVMPQPAGGMYLARCHMVACLPNSCIASGFSGEIFFPTFTLTDGGFTITHNSLDMFAAVTYTWYAYGL